MEGEKWIMDDDVVGMTWGKRGETRWPAVGRRTTDMVGVVMVVVLLVLSLLFYGFAMIERKIETQI